MIQYISILLKSEYSPVVQKKQVYILGGLLSVLLICIVLLQGCTSSLVETSGNSPKRIVKPLNSFFREQPLPLSKSDSAQMSHIALEYYIQASELELVEKYAEAILAYQRVLRFDSTSAVFYSIGKCYNALGQIDLAIEFTQKALKIDSVSIPALEQLALLTVFYSKEEYKAIEVYKRMYALDSNRLSVLTALARLTEFTDAKESAFYYSKAVFKSGYDDEIVRNYGALLIQLRDSLSYITLMENQYYVHPESKRARALLVEAYSKFKRYEQALSLIEQCTLTALDEELEEYYQALTFSILLSKDTNSKEIIEKYLPSFEKFPILSWKVLISFALLSDYAEEIEQAEKFYKRSARLADSSTITEAIALAYELLSNNSGIVAEHYIKVYASVYPLNPSFPFLLGIMYRGKQVPSEAIVQFSEAIRRDPKYADAWSELASIYAQGENFAKSDSCYSKALELEPENPRFNNNFAYALSDRPSELFKALDLSKKAISLEPENGYYLDTYGWILYQQGNNKKALPILEKAVFFTFEQSATILYHLSESYKKEKDIENAIKVIKKALMIEPDNSIYLKSLKNLTE